MQKSTTPLQELLHKEMSRKEFLATLGFGVASVFGFSSLIKMLNGSGKANNVSSGYGSSAYGGSASQKNV